MDSCQWVDNKVFLSLIMVLTLLCARSEAQDNHYWAQQYGATGTLMGGAMIGGADDNSAVYYNPGALAFIGNTSLSVDANVYRLDRIIISDGAGRDMNLNSAQLSVYPQIIAGMLNLFKNSKFRVSYTMLTRNHGNVLMNTRYTSETPSAGNSSPISFVGVFDYVNQLTEQWFGAAAGYRITDKLGVGAVLFVSYRGQTYQLTNYVQEVEQGEFQDLFRTKHKDGAIRYSLFGILGKFGVSYKNDQWRLGATLTTPSLGIYGTGDVQRENSIITVSEDPEDMKNNFLIMDRQSGEKARYRHPLSLGAGAEYRKGKMKLALSAEYFFSTGVYHMVAPVSVPFVYPASYLDSASYRSLIDNYLHVEIATRPVMNGGIGFSCGIADRLNLLLGMSTDFTSYDQSAGSDELFSAFGAYDIYHFSAGLQYNHMKHAVTLGFSYSFTPSQRVPPYTIINQGQDLTEDALLKAHSNAIILGYTYYFSRTGE